MGFLKQNNGSNGCGYCGKFHHRCLAFTFKDNANDVCKSLAPVLSFMRFSFPAVQSSLFFQTTNNNKTRFPHRRYTLTTGRGIHPLQKEEKLTRTRKFIWKAYFLCKIFC